MNTPIYVAPPTIRLPDVPPPLPSGGETSDLLRQLLDVQKEQLALAKTAAAASDSGARWKGFLAKWQGEFPDVGQAVRQVLPAVERVYLRMIQELADRLRGDDADDLDNEFALAEFLDRYGMRLSQLGTIMGQLAPIADASPPADEKVTSG
jgi:hypothetical protein